MGPSPQQHQVQVIQEIQIELQVQVLPTRGFAKFRLFAMFPVLLTILIMWTLCAILTQVQIAFVSWS